MAGELAASSRLLLNAVRLKEVLASVHREAEITAEFFSVWFFEDADPQRAEG